MTAYSIVKSATELVVSAGVGSIVGNTIKRSIPANAKKINRLSMAIGGFVISSMAAEYASNFTSAKLDGAALFVKTVRDNVKAELDRVAEETAKLENYLDKLPESE